MPITQHQAEVLVPGNTSRQLSSRLLIKCGNELIKCGNELRITTDFNSLCVSAYIRCVRACVRACKGVREGEMPHRYWEKESASSR